MVNSRKGLAGGAVAFSMEPWQTAQAILASTT